MQGTSYSLLAGIAKKSLLNSVQFFTINNHNFNCILWSINPGWSKTHYQVAVSSF
jgi:hypothetical protein